MDPKTREARYDEVRRCLAEADRAFTLAGAMDEGREKSQLIEEAERWLMEAERRLARLADRPLPLTQPHKVQGERRSFNDLRPAHRSLVWRRQPKV